MHSKLRVVAPEKHIMLVMDCAQCHTCTKVLSLCRALKISVVLVPGQCTWLLQPLDTHVLKRILQTERTKAAMAEPGGVVNDAVNIKAVGHAIHETLVRTSWSGAMARVGLAATWDTLRETLQNLCG